MRPLALTLAFFWSLQVLVCLAPAVSAGSQERRVAEQASHDHHAAAPVQGTAAGDRAAHSHAPGSDGHPGSDGGCAQHCASLSQTVTARSGAAPVPNLSLVAIVLAPATGNLPRRLAGAVTRLDLGRPPPDNLAHVVALRI